MSGVITIAQLEWQAAVRLKWVRVLTIAFALLAIAAAYSAGVANELSGADGFERTTMTLIPVALILVPLASLVLGITGQCTEPGSEPFLFAQPIGRTAVLLGRWLGESAAIATATAVGLGCGAVVIAFGNGMDGFFRYAFFVAASIALGVIFLSIAATIAASSPTRAAALGVGTFVWFIFVLLYDAAALSIAGWITGPLGGRLLFTSVFLNPADLARIAMLSIAGTPNVLGAAGEAWVRFLGGTLQAGVLCGAALATWMACPLAIASQVLSRRDL